MISTNHVAQSTTTSDMSEIPSGRLTTPQWRSPDFTDWEQVPSHSRLKRFADGWSPLTQPDMMARIIVLQHGGHQRPVITRGGRHQRQRHISRKTGLTQVSEGLGEDLLTMYNEVDGRVVDYQCHPFRIEAIKADGKFSYRPDAILQRRDGSIELIEVKRTPDDLSDPSLREKFAIVCEIARRCDWRFRVLYLADIRGPRPRVANVEAVYGRRSMALSQSESAIAASLIRDGQPVVWHDVRDRLAPSDSLRGDAAIECLIARGQLLVDLDARFTPATIIQPVAPFTGISEIRL